MQTDGYPMIGARFLIANLIWFYGSYITHASGTGNDKILLTSNESVSWQEAAESSHAFLSYDVIKKNGWDVIAGDIPENQTFWIAARAQQSLFVSWEGCVDWIGGQNCSTAVEGGSIADCLQNCKHGDHYILLKGLDCRCVPKQDAESCFNQSNQICNTQCLNNPNDRCGGNGSTMSLYFTGPFGRNIKDSKGQKDCMVLKIVTESGKKINVIDTVYFQSEGCTLNVRRFFCSDNSVAIDSKKFLSWFDAYERCNDLGLHLKFNISDTRISKTVYWTSIKRSVLLRWTTEAEPDFPYCVSVRKDISRTLVLEDEGCDKEYRYLFMQENDVISYEKSGLSEEYDVYYWFFILPIFALITVVLVIHLRRKRTRKICAAKLQNHAVDTWLDTTPSLITFPKLLSTNQGSNNYHINDFDTLRPGIEATTYHPRGDKMFQTLTLIY